MSRTETIADRAARRQLVARVAASRYISKSARLKELLVYLCERVLDGSATEIHEQEVGSRVFGREPDYNTAADNIVRVNASLLRKRLEQYFAADGAAEPLIVEIPKGNYAPVFRERAEQPAAPGRRRMWPLAAVALVCAVAAAYLLFRAGSPEGASPNVRLFWAQVFRPDQTTNIVLDDAAVGLYQELTGRAIGLNEYFDRSYLRHLDRTAAEAGLDLKLATELVLRRQSSYAGMGLVWKLFQAAGPLQRQASMQFARDFSFRALKSDNAILLGHGRVNPWVEAFDARTGLRWVYQEDLGIYHPVDSWSPAAGRDRFRVPNEPGEPREGYCMVTLVPNLGGSGNVLIVGGTGGSAVAVCADFLSDEKSMAGLRKRLPAAAAGKFPYFEALLQFKRRSAASRDVTVPVCRSPKL